MRETPRDYRHAEDAGVPHALSDRTNDIASLLDIAPITMAVVDLSTVVHG